SVRLTPGGAPGGLGFFPDAVFDALLDARLEVGLALLVLRDHFADRLVHHRGGGSLAQHKPGEARVQESEDPLDVEERDEDRAPAGPAERELEAVEAPAAAELARHGRGF